MFVHLQQGTKGRSDGWNLLRRIVDLTNRREWNVKFVHAYHKANRCANALAIMGGHQIETIRAHDKIPEEVAKVALDYLRGVTTLRAIMCSFLFSGPWPSINSKKK